MVSSKAVFWKIRKWNGFHLSVQGTVLLVVITLGLLFAASPAFAAGGSCPSGNVTIDPNGNQIPLSNLGITSCFYVSKSAGSDSNSGTSEISPWAHLPGMPSCTGTCASTSPASGEGFILRGGDTWTSSDLGISWNWSGTSSNNIYIGIDPSWYNSGVCASWCRPILHDSGGTNNIINFSSSASYAVWDNIEVTGMGTHNGFGFEGSSNNRATRMYFHAWAYSGNANNGGFFSQCGRGSMIDHNIMDGSDSTKNTMNGVYSSCAGTIAYNYFSYMVSGVLGNTDDVHDNVFSNTVTSAGGDHCNLLFTFSPASGNTQLIYNNLLFNGGGCGGGISVWFNGNGGGNANWAGYGFNNVMYNLGSNPVNLGNHGSVNNGNYYWFNNTVDTTAGGAGGPAGNGYWTMHDNNNHVVGGALQWDCPGFGACTVPVCELGAGAGCTDVTQSASVAKGQGYSSSETYPYAPISTCTSSTCSTVGSGTNAQSYCSTLAGTSGVGTAAAAIACQSSTTLACAYKTSDHTLSCPGTPVAVRPASGAWDIGAYQFGAESAGPNPPTGLSVVVN